MARSRSRSRERDRRSPERRDKRKRSRSREREKEREDRSTRDRRERSRSRERRRDREDRDRKSRSPEKRRRRSEERQEDDRDDRKHDRRDDREKNKSDGRKHTKEEEDEDEENGKKTSDASKKVEPLSLEELLKKRQEKAAAESKPVFMTKAQREAAALARLQEQAQETRKRQEEQRRGLRGGDMGAASREAAEADRKRREEERKERADQREREKELEGIKIQYLGEKKVKKKIVRPSEKFRFTFDWENTEDTSRDVNPLYNNPHQAALLFGRGLRAGIDRKEQKKSLAQHEKSLLAQMRTTAGSEATREDREREKAQMRRAEASDEQYFTGQNVHWSEKKLEDMTERDWRIFKEDFNIAFKGGKLMNPIRNWEEANMPKTLLRAIQKVGYEKPSPIQMASIPLGLAGRDVIGVAETGSGKTCAFVVPMLAYIRKQPPLDETNEAEGPYALVMAPTRELAQQIEEETVKFSHYMDYRVVSVVGGQSIEEQGFKLRRGCEVVIATPGRLLDCLESRYTVLNQCNYVVLDEADRMIDLGFEPQVVGVLEAMPSTNLKPVEEDAALDVTKIYRTTYMFSATMPPAVERLARKFMRNPAVVNIGNAGKAADLITQTVIMTKENQKLELLDNLLYQLSETETVIVFVNIKAQCDYVHKHLSHSGYLSTVLHGGKTQEAREESLKGFKDKRYRILVATDVAGRGIDVPDVAHVVNYAMPGSIDNYTHRIGRTGRAGKKGTATTFLCQEDKDVFFDLKKFLKDNNQAIPSELDRHESAKEKPDPFKRKRDTTIFASR